MSSRGWRRNFYPLREGEAVGRQRRQHDSDEDEDFFERAIVFASTDKDLTKAPAKRLEAQLSNRIKADGRFTPMNANKPSGAALLEADADVECFSIR